MKKSFVIDYSLYLAAKNISLILRFVPLGLSIFIIRAIGALAFYCMRKKRAKAYKNIKIAFPQYSCREINKVIKKAFMNSGQHFVEIFYLPWLNKRYIEKYMEFEGLDRVREIIKDKKGVIFLGLHEGSWEISSVVLAQLFREYKYTVLARPQKNIPLLNELLNGYRAKNHCGIIKIKDNLRPLVEHLKKGLAFGMVADHGAQGGVFVNFFGKLALTPTGAVRVALKLDTHLIVGFMKRKGGAYHKITLVPFSLIRSGNAGEDLTKINLEKINRMYEEFIRECPEEYLWFFKRWKYSPQRNILVLSDGKVGHLKQSLAVLDMIKTLPFEVKADIVDIKFKNKWRRFAFEACGFFFSSKCQGCMGCLRKLLGCEESRKLLSHYYDVVISCGSSLSMVNRLIAFENIAKSIVVMKPGMFSLKRFDLAIMPEHDHPPRLSSVVSIKGAISAAVNANKEDVRDVVKRYGLDEAKISHPVIGLILGGDNKYLFLDAEIIKAISNSLKQVLNTVGATLLISTSRRTPQNVELILKDEFKDYPRCRMLVIANEFNPKGTIETMLHCSDILIISGDSISMVSEGINSGKYILVFKLKRKNPNLSSKHERFVENLERDNYIKVISHVDLPDKIIEIWKDRPPTKELHDRDIILDRLKKIL